LPIIAAMKLRRAALRDASIQPRGRAHPPTTGEADASRLDASRDDRDGRPSSALGSPRSAREALGLTDPVLESLDRRHAVTRQAPPRAD
jgi:hypothetical protein